MTTARLVVLLAALIVCISVVDDSIYYDSSSSKITHDDDHDQHDQSRHYGHYNHSAYGETLIDYSYISDHHHHHHHQPVETETTSTSSSSSCRPEESYDYIVTGGAGFIGSNLIKRLLSANPASRIRVVDNLWRGSLKNLKYSNYR